MATVILVRHGRTTANATGVLAGRTVGVKARRDPGRRQADRTGERLAAVPARRASSSSPLERCRQTSRPILAPSRDGACDADRERHHRVRLRRLAGAQARRNSPTEPSGERRAARSRRPRRSPAASRMRGHAGAGRRGRSGDRDARGRGRARARRACGSRSATATSSRRSLADALGMHLDLFQRINVNPASVSIVRYGAARPDVVIDQHRRRETCRGCAPRRRPQRRPSAAEPVAHHRPRRSWRPRLRWIACHRSSTGTFWPGVVVGTVGQPGARRSAIRRVMSVYSFSYVLFADLVVSILGSKRSAWNTADLRGKTEVLVAQTALVADRAVRVALAEDITARAAERCTSLLDRPGVPEHVRSLTSPRVLEVEADLITRLAQRGTEPARRVRLSGGGLVRVDPTQAAMVGVLAGNGHLVVVEGAAGAGKTTALRATREVLAQRARRMIVVTPTLKAAEVAAVETGAEGHSASWLIHQYGWRWDDDGHWSRGPAPTPQPSARLRPGDLLLVDEAGMLDQDVASALLTLADETGARLALVGDRHQLPAVGRGGVLDHAIGFAHPTAVVTLESVHRFTDPAYADLA